MNDETARFLCLLDELETSHKLIKAGFGALQEIDTTNDFYHLPHQLMASGLERLMKCYLSIIYEDRHGSFPDLAYMKGLGHDLADLLATVISEGYGGLTRPLLRQELDFLKSDSTLAETVRILSLFGKFGRYYNLDVVAGSSKGPIDPKSEWEDLESTIEDSTPYLQDAEALHNDYFPRVNSILIATLERLVRAIAFQFTIGDHPDSFGRLRQTSVVFSDFRSLRDEELGTVEYRRSVQILKQREDEWIHRAEREVLNGGWPTQVIERSGYDGDWPFRANRVLIECREELFCIVNVNGYAFALNGAAASRFKLPFPHDAGVAVLGKSVGPFIDMARELGKF